MQIHKKKILVGGNKLCVCIPLFRSLDTAIFLLQWVLKMADNATNNYTHYQTINEHNM